MDGSQAMGGAKNTEEAVMAVQQELTKAVSDENFWGTVSSWFGF